jgi:hypothetical protein
MVAHTLHKHSLGVLLGPQLPHSLLLLLLRWRLVVLLLLWWSLLLLLLGWCLSLLLLLLLLLSLRFRCLCCLVLPLMLWRVMGLLAYCFWVRLLGSRGLLLLPGMRPGLLLLYRGSWLPLHLLRLLGALLCSLWGHCCLGCRLHMRRLLQLIAWSFRLDGSRGGMVLRLQRPASSKHE